MNFDDFIIEGIFKVENSIFERRDQLYLTEKIDGRII